MTVGKLRLETATQSSSRRWVKRKAQLRRWLTSYLMLTPFLLLFFLFVIYPIGQSAYLSLTEYTGIKAPRYIGIENFTELLTDKRFGKAMVNVSQYVVLSVVLNAVLGLVLALAFRAQDGVTKVFRTLFFLPAVTSSIASFTVWGWILTGEDYGLANTVRQWLGLEPMRYLSTPNLAIPIMVTLALWGGLGMTMIFYLAGLQSIGKEFIEASAIDGAAGWARLRYIILPLLRPTILYIVITGTIGAFQVFDVGYVLFSGVSSVGGVLDSALTPVLYLYFMAFNRFRLGYASAIAWLLFAIIIVLTLINLRVGRANEAD